MAKRRISKPQGQFSSVNHRAHTGIPEGPAVIESASLPSGREAMELRAARALANSTRFSMPVPNGPPLRASSFRLSEPRNHRTIHGPDIDLLWDASELKLGVRPAFLEIFEIRPHEGPYETAPRLYKVGDVADWVLRMVRRKQKIYASKPFRPMFLLMFAGDDAFRPSMELLLYLVRALRLSDNAPFLGIFIGEFGSKGFGHAQQLFPDGDHLFGGLPLEKIDVLAFRRKQMVNVDPRLVAFGGSHVRADGKQASEYLINVPEGTDMEEFERVSRSGDGWFVPGLFSEDD